MILSAGVEVPGIVIARAMLTNIFSTTQPLLHAIVALVELAMVSFIVRGFNASYARRPVLTTMITNAVSLDARPRRPPPCITDILTSGPGRDRRHRRPNADCHPPAQASKGTESLRHRR